MKEQMRTLYKQFVYSLSVKLILNLNTAEVYHTNNIQFYLHLLYSIVPVHVTRYLISIMILQTI